MGRLSFHSSPPSLENLTISTSQLFLIYFDFVIFTTGNFSFWEDGVLIFSISKALFSDFFDFPLCFHCSVSRGHNLWNTLCHFLDTQNIHFWQNLLIKKQKTWICLKVAFFSDFFIKWSKKTHKIYIFGGTF